MPPVRMTRAEYEAKYGKAPTVSTSTLDTTPAPIRMTRAEYDQLYGAKSEPTDTPSVSFGADFEGDRNQTFQRQEEVRLKGNETIRRIDERAQNGEISPIKAFFQRTGNSIKYTAQYLGEGARGAAKMVLPEQTEQKVGQFLNDYTGALASRVKEDYDQLKTSTDERDVALANKVDEAMNLYQTDETFRTDVDAAGGILTAVSTALGMRTPSPDLKAPNLPELKNKIINTRETFAASKADAETQTIADKLFDIENSYVKTRKANARQKDEGSESRLRVAQSNVLADSVDGNGVIITLGKNGAYEQYKAATIGDSESVVRDILKQEGKTIKAKDIEAELKYAVSSSGVEGADLVEALNGVERELQGLVMRADLDGNVPLDKLQDFKTSQYERIDFNESKSNQIYRKALARAYKEMIEETSDADIKEINSELGKYYEDLARIKALDGKRVEGGRIGRAIAKTGGFVVGAGLGSVGGGLGSALGAAAGAKFADTLKSAAMKRALRGTDRDIPVNEVLAGAKLRIADKPITIPAKDLNPQSEATLFKINQNVIQQEKAIKSQDWNTVVALKQVYGLLIERLDNQLSDANISYTNQPKTAPNSSSILDRVKQFKESVKSDPLADFKEGRPNKQGGYIKNPLAKDNQDVSSVNDSTPTTLLENEVVNNTKNQSMDSAILNDMTTNTNDLPKTVRVWKKSKFSNDGGYADVPVIRREDNITLYQGGKDEGRQFWTHDRKYAEHFGEVTEKTGSFYQIDNGNRMTNVYIEVPNGTKPTLLEEAKKYKSAEEFVKAQPKFYHGGDKIDSVSTRKSRFQNTFYFTDSPDYAKSYGGKNSVVNDIYLDPSVNLIDLRNPSEGLVSAIADKLNGKDTGKILKITRPDGTVLEIPEVKGGASNPVYTNKQILQGIVDGKAMFIELPEVKKILKEMGYDGLITTESKMGSNYGVWNSEKVKTKKEMEELWNSQS